MATHSSILAWRIPLDRGAWWATVYKATKSQTWLTNTQHTYSSVQSLNRVRSLWPHESQHAKPPCPSPTPGVYPNSCPLSRWCHPAISSSAVPFSSCPQSLPASGSIQMSPLFASGGQCFGVSASTLVLPMSIQNWFPLGWTGWTSLQSEGLSRVFSNTTVQKHQFFPISIVFKPKSWATPFNHWFSPCCLSCTHEVHMFINLCLFFSY